MTSLLGDDIILTRKLGVRWMMKKEDILEMSRKENKNRDLAELDVMVQVSSIAGRVGACVCVLLAVSFFD